MGGLLHLVQRGGACAGSDPAQYVPSRSTRDVTAHPSTASVPLFEDVEWRYNCLWTLYRVKFVVWLTDGFSLKWT